MVKDGQAHSPEKQIRASVHKASTPRKDKDFGKDKDKDKGQFLGDAGDRTGRGSAPGASSREDSMLIDSSPTPPPPAGGLHVAPPTGEISLATIFSQLQTVLQGQSQLLQGYKDVEARLGSLGSKVDAHDSRLEAVERQIAQVKQARAHSLPRATALSSDNTSGKRPRSFPPASSEAHHADDDRYQRTLVVNGWTENLAREELVSHGRRLLQNAKDAMVVVRQKFDTRLLLVYASKQQTEAEFGRLREAQIYDGDIKLWVSKDKPAIFKRRDYILRSLKRLFLNKFQVNAEQVTQDYRGGTVYLGKQTVFFVREHKIYKGRGWSDSWDWSGFVEAANELLCL
eukprot:899691-Amphidinium_carterae.1